MDIERLKESEVEMRSNNSNNVSATGIGFTGLLQVAFIVLKLIGVINWSWFWVFSPIWVTLSIAVIAIIAILIFSIILTRPRKK